MRAYHTLYTVIFCLLFCGLTKPARAQYYATKIYTATEGVSGGIMNVFQHSDGAIWYSTYDKGIYRYDGQHYKHYSTKNGMANDQSLNLFEDNHGNVWSNSHEHGTSYITPQGKVVVVEKTTNNQGVRDVHFNKSTNQVFGYKTFEITEKYDFDKKSFIFWDSLYFDKKKYEIIYRDYWLIKKNVGYLIWLKDKKTNQAQYFECKNGQTTPFDTPKGIDISQFRNVFFDLDDNMFITTATDLYTNKNNTWKIVANFKKMGIEDGQIISGIYYSNHSYNCVSDNKDGISCTLFSLSEDFKTCSQYPFKYSGGKVYFGNTIKDRAGNFWITSQLGLIKVMPSIFMVGEGANNIPPTLYQVQEDKYGKVWFGSYRDGAAYLEDGKIQKAPSALNKLGTFYFAGTMLDKNSDMLLMTENMGIMRFDGKNKFSTTNFLDIKNNEITTVAYCIYKDKKGQILLGSYSKGIGIIAHEDSIQRNRPTRVRYLREDKGITTGNVLTITEDNYGRYWFGRPSKGIGVYDPTSDKGVTFERKDANLDYGAMSSVTDSYGNIWFGTDKGLCYFVPPAAMPDSTFAFRKNLRLIASDILGNNPITALKIWNNKYLIIGNELGMSFLDLELFYRSKGQKVVVRVLQKYGAAMRGAGQNAISFDSQNRAWAILGEGVLRFDPSLFVADTVPPIVSLDSIVQGKKSYNLHRSTWFSAGHNALSIYFHSPASDLMYENITYRYRLKSNSEWLDVSKENMIEFQNLTSGNYNIEIQAQKDGMVSEIAKVAFRILPWYVSAEWIVALLSMCVAFGFWRHNKTQIQQLEQQKLEQAQKEKAFLQEQKEKEYQLKQREIELLLLQKEQEMEDQLLEQNKLQVQAIVNQLNPHFINNALNWIQTQVWKDEEVLRVVSKLADNIRIIFRNSKEKKPYHSLKNEMILVENYIFIQKKRVGSVFEFEISNPDFIEQFGHIDVPLLSLQLHCENAVEHGIKNRDEEEGGSLKISFTEGDEHYINISIEDNGVGREKAKEMESHGTQQGTKMLRDLESIFNKINEYPIYTQLYEDNYLETQEGERYGTKVTLRIPKKYRYEF